MRQRKLDDSVIEQNSKLYVISISQSEADLSVHETAAEILLPYFKQDHKNVIRLFFDDVKFEGPVWTPGGMRMTKMFTSEEAKKIIDFAETIEPESEILVHCLMGKSRSAAVGKWLGEKFDVEVTEQREDVEPNERVLVYLREVHNDKNKTK